MFAFGVYGLCGYVSDLVWLLMVFCFVGGVLFVGDMIGFWVRVAWGLVCGDCGFDLNCWGLVVLLVVAGFVGLLPSLRLYW